MDIIKANFSEAYALLQAFISDEQNLSKIKEAGDVMVAALKSGNKILSCGNGGSMCDAMHFAEEMTGRFRKNREPFAAFSLSDASHITCSANDYGYNSIFSRSVKALGASGDVLLAISTSGNSENIIAATKTALEKGMKVIALTGKTGGEMSNLATVELRVPHLGWSDRIQEIHIKIIHTLIDYIETNIELQ